MISLVEGGGEREKPHHILFTLTGLDPTLKARRHAHTTLHIYPCISLLNLSVMTPSQPPSSVPMTFFFLKINIRWLGAAKKNRHFNRKIHKGFKYQGHQLLGYFPRAPGSPTFEPSETQI